MLRLLLGSAVLFLAVAGVRGEIPAMDGSIDPTPFIKATAEALAKDKATPEELIAAAEGCQILGTLTQGIALGTAALEGFKEDPTKKAKAHWILALLQVDHFENTKAMANAKAGLALLGEEADPFLQYQLHAVMTRATAEVPSAKDLRTASLEKSVEIAAAGEGTAWNCRQARALGRLIGSQSNSDEELEQISKAVALTSDLDEEKASAEELALTASTRYWAGLIGGRHHTKANPLPITPTEHYEEAIRLAEVIEERFPHRKISQVHGLAYQISREEEEDGNLKSDGSQTTAIEGTLETITTMVEDSDNRDWLWLKARAHSLLYGEYYESKAYEAALEQAEEAVALRTRLLDPKNGGERLGERLYALSYDHRTRSYPLSRLSRSDESKEAYQKAMEIAEQGVQLSPENLKIVNWFSSMSGYLARIVDNDDAEAAAQLYAHEAEVMEDVIKKIGKQPEDHTFQSNLGSAYHEQAKLLKKVEDFDDEKRMTAIYRQVVEHRTQSLKINPSCSSCSRYLWRGYHDLAVSLALQIEDPENPVELVEAAAVLDKGIEAAQKAVETSTGSSQTHASKALGTLQVLRRQFGDVLEGKAPRQR